MCKHEMSFLVEWSLRIQIVDTIATNLVTVNTNNNFLRNNKKIFFQRYRNCYIVVV